MNDLLIRNNAQNYRSPGSVDVEHVNKGIMNIGSWRTDTPLIRLSPDRARNISREFEAISEEFMRYMNHEGAVVATPICWLNCFLMNVIYRGYIIAEANVIDLCIMYHYVFNHSLYLITAFFPFFMLQCSVVLQYSCHGVSYVMFCSLSNMTILECKCVIYILDNKNDIFKRK